MKKWSWLVAPAFVIALAALPALAQGSRTADKIWVIGSGGTAPAATTLMRYGNSFSAGWQSAKVSFPWAHAQCWTVDAAGNKKGASFWDEWRALQADGTIGTFQLDSADPQATWPAGGGVCNLSLVSLQGSRAAVIAISADFPVGP